MMNLLLSVGYATSMHTTFTNTEKLKDDPFGINNVAFGFNHLKDFFAFLVVVYRAIYLRGENYILFWFCFLFCHY